jgi:hypothetical protein
LRIPFRTIFFVLLHFFAEVGLAAAVTAFELFLSLFHKPFRIRESATGVPFVVSLRQSKKPLDP